METDWANRKTLGEIQELQNTSVSAAECGNLTHQAQPELIIKLAELAPNNCFGVNRPCSTQTRSKVCLGREFGIVFPTKSEIERQVFHAVFQSS